MCRFLKIFPVLSVILLHRLPPLHFRAVPWLSKCCAALLLSQLDADYVRTAYSRGNSTRRVMYHHVLKNALIPVLTFWGMTIADIVANSIILEQVFSIPGMGNLLITSISNRDYPVVQGILVLIAALIIIINFVVDLLYGRIDPRIRVKD